MKPRKGRSVCEAITAVISEAVMWRAPAIRGVGMAAFCGETSGSRPLPEVVRASAGMTAPGMSLRMAAASLFIRSISFWSMGPRLEPPEFIGS